MRQSHEMSLVFFAYADYDYVSPMVSHFHTAPRLIKSMFFFSSQHIRESSCGLVLYSTYCLKKILSKSREGLPLRLFCSQTIPLPPL
jgi:hypothetical protein